MGRHSKPKTTKPNKTTKTQTTQSKQHHKSTPPTFTEVVDQAAIEYQKDKRMRRIRITVTTLCVIIALTLIGGAGWLLYKDKGVHATQVAQCTQQESVNRDLRIQASSLRNKGVETFNSIEDSARKQQIAVLNDSTMPATITVDCTIEPDYALKQLTSEHDKLRTYIDKYAAAGVDATPTTAQ